MRCTTTTTTSAVVWLNERVCQGRKGKYYLQKVRRRKRSEHAEYGSSPPTFPRQISTGSQSEPTRDSDTITAATLFVSSTFVSRLVLASNQELRDKWSVLSLAPSGGKCKSPPSDASSLVDLMLRYNFTLLPLNRSNFLASIFCLHHPFQKRGKKWFIKSQR